MYLFTEIFDFFLPRFCPSCNKNLTTEERIICPECLGKIQRVNEERLQLEYQKKFLSKKIISGFTSLYLFEKDKELQAIIHAIKYNQRFLIGKFLGKLVGKNFEILFNDWQIDFIIPIPLHHLKKAERGYNQSFYIAKGIGKQTNIPVNVYSIKRKRFTQSQTLLNQKEREENINGAFSIHRFSNITGKNILLVDDVITTGATINECGKVLIDNGVKNVYAASLAIAD
ncbi:MAG: ComF family protein [Bacteroidetes bacterium]|nr:ComF family protein [Bacteroidota bacterium]